MSMAFFVCITIFSAFHHPSSLLPLPYLIISIAYTLSPSSTQCSLPCAAHRNSDTMIPLPLDLGFSHSDPAFFQLNEGLSFALKVLSSWVTRWRRLMLGVGGGWIEISPSSLNSLSVLKISYDMPINPQCSPLCIRLYN